MSLTETKYRNFDDLLNSVKIDMYTWDLEGLINPQQLIKVAIRVNYDLGVRISPSCSKAIDVVKGKAKLPENFDILNLALVCEDRMVSEIPTYNKTYSEGLLEGVVLAQNFLEPRFVNQSTIFTDIVQGINVINHNLHSLNTIVQAFATDGTLLDFEVFVIDSDNIRIISESSETIVNVKVVVMGAKISTVGTGSGSCPALLDCNTDGTPKVHYTTNGRKTESKSLIPLKMEKSKSISSDCLNLNSKSYYSAYIKNGYLHVNFDEGVLFINYQSVMEDDDGNLLVIDNPYCNEYYEYALKQRIYENLFLSGEQVQNHLNLMEQKLRAARNNALSFVNTPDFAEMKTLHNLNRKAQYSKYYDMFKNYNYG